MPLAIEQQAELNAARRDNELARLRAETEALTGQATLREAWGDYVGNRDPEDANGQWRSLGGGSGNDDRSDGSEPRVFRNEQEHAAVRSEGSRIYLIAPPAKSAMNNLLNYTFFTGFKYGVAAKEGEQVPEALLDDVRGIVQDFIVENKWSLKRPRELYRRSEVYGDGLVALNHIGHGHVKARFVEPGCLCEPQDPAKLADWLGIPSGDWTYGVHTTQGDTEDVLGYHIRWSNKPNDFTYYPTRYLHHIKANVDEGVKVGISGFYPVVSYIDDAMKLLGNTGKGGAIMSAIAMIRKHAPGTTNAQISSFAGNLAHQISQRHTPQGSKLVRNVTFPSGTVVDTRDGQEYGPGPLATQGVGPAMVVIYQALLRTTGTIWCMPEYMISGDASNSNLASILKAESPFLMYCQVRQAEWGQEEIELFWKVIGIALAAGRLSRWNYSLLDLMRLIDLIAEPPVTSIRDGEKETYRLKTLRDAGIIADPTWAKKEGFNHEDEVRHGAKVHGQVMGLESHSLAGNLFEGYP